MTDQKHEWRGILAEHVAHKELLPFLEAVADQVVGHTLKVVDGEKERLRVAGAAYALVLAAHQREADEFLSAVRTQRPDIFEEFLREYGCVERDANGRLQLDSAVNRLAENHEMLQAFWDHWHLLVRTNADQAVRALITDAKTLRGESPDDLRS